LPTRPELESVGDYDGTYIYGCGTTINNDIANYLGSNHPNGTVPVGSYEAYGYGLCDMAGNAGEWTSTVVPSGIATNGGVWLSIAEDCQISVPNSVVLPQDLNFYMGFRVCR